MKNKFSPSVSIILRRSKDQAMQLKSSVVMPVHILLAMLKDADNNAAQLLRTLQPDTPKLVAQLEGVAQPLDKEVVCHDDEVVMNDTATKVMRLSMLESRNLKSDVIDTEHILLAILRSGDKDTNDVLSDNNIHYSDIMACLTQETRPNVSNGFGFADEEDDEDMDVRFSKPSSQTRRKPTPTRSSVDKDTPVLSNFCTDLTLAASEGKLDPVVGREVEIERVAQILSRRKKNNPILIGEPGVGKSAIMEGLAMRIVEHRIARVLWDKRIFVLNLSALVAGTKYRGQFEERVNALLNELKRHPEAIIFIDEIHNIIGAGNQAGQMDVANMLKPELARGIIQCVGATTIDEYRKSIEKDGALERRFQKVMVRPTTPDETLQILRNLAPHYEEHHHVSYTPEALEACVRLTERYVTDRAFPDKAIDALDEAGARKHIMEVPIPGEITRQEDIVDHLTTQKDEAIASQNFELAADYRDKLVCENAKLTELRTNWEQSLSQTRTEVDADHVADVVAMMTGIPVQRISQEEGSRLRRLDASLRESVIGQDEAIRQISRSIQRSRIGLKDPNKPIGTFLFVGPTGVGKTYLAQRLALEMFGSRDALIRIDMSEYGEKHTVSRLVGAPPGYVGYEEGGQLTERVRRKPYSIVLLDELEKAHPDVFNILLQVMDEGRLTDGNGATISFKNTIIIMTSNCGTRQLKEFGQGVGFGRLSDDALSNKDYAHSVVKKSLERQFAPEFLNRLDDIIHFEQLTRQSIDQIIDIELQPIIQRVHDLGYRLTVDAEARTLIATRGYDAQYGARPLKRALQTLLEDALCDLLMADEAPTKGSTIRATLAKDKTTLTLRVTKPRKKTIPTPSP